MFPQSHYYAQIMQLIGYLYINYGNTHNIVAMGK